MPKSWKRIRIAYLLTGVVFMFGVLLVSTIDSTPSSTAAGSTTDALTVALRVAQAHGLQGDPTSMYIVSGVYQNLQGSTTEAAETRYDNNTVYLVQIQKNMIFNEYGVRNKPISYLYIYIDTVSGLPFQTTASSFPLTELGGYAWQWVTRADSGRFPVVTYQSATSNAAAQSATATPLPSRP